MSRIMSFVAARKFSLARPATAPIKLCSAIRKPADANVPKIPSLKRSTANKGARPFFFRRMTNAVSPGVAGESKINEILKKKFPNATNITVEDISGGCGDMFEVHVESEKDFAGLRTVAQHKLVTTALKDEVPKMHGLRIFTYAKNI